MPTFFTDKQVDDYIAGWRETHPEPEDELDRGEVESILEEEERERMIQLLVKDDLEVDARGGGDLFTMVLRDGFTGYNHESDINLRDEILERGLEDMVWGDWYEY